jgi:hypothetical protein
LSLHRFVQKGNRGANIENTLKLSRQIPLWNNIQRCL